jgi:hypothetical protein
MQGEEKEHWKELCEQASTEQESKTHRSYPNSSQRSTECCSEAKSFEREKTLVRY